jgi:hypothetical protein
MPFRTSLESAGDWRSCRNCSGGSTCSDEGLGLDGTSHWSSRVCPRFCETQPGSKCSHLCRGNDTQMRRRHTKTLPLRQTIQHAIRGGLVNVDRRKRCLRASSNRMVADLHGSRHEASERGPVDNSDARQRATGSCEEDGDPQCAVIPQVPATTAASLRMASLNL